MIEQDKNKTLKKELVKILEEDIKKIKEIIREKYYEVNYDIKNAKEPEKTSSIDLNIFKTLTNEVCFDNLSHTKRRPFSILPGQEPDFFNETVYDIPTERLDMFIKLFKVKEQVLNFPSETYTISHSSIKAKELYYLFFFSLFHRFINSNKTIEHILNDLLSEWRTALKTKKIPILFNVFLDRILIEKNYGENQKFRIEKIYHTETIRLSPYKANIYSPDYLVFEAEIPILIYENFDAYEKKNNREVFEIFNTMEKKFEKFKDFLCALYFHKYYLWNPHAIIRLPWWIEPEYQYLKKSVKREGDNFIFKEICRLSESDYNNILNTYYKLEEKGFYSRSCFPLLFSVKNLAFSEPANLERIFYAHTLLEFLFTPRPIIDLSFKIPLNASLLISDSFNEFYQTFIFFRKMYNFRSRLIHGDDWVNELTRMIDKLKDYGFQIRSITELFEKFEQFIIKILNRILNFNTINSRIMESLEDNKITSYRRRMYEYLIKLGDCFEGEDNYKLSIKAFSEAFYTAQLLDNNSRIFESGNKIKHIYNIDENISIYQNELNLILSELTLLSKFNEKKKNISKEIQDKFSELKSKTEPQTTENIIVLALDGNEIMRETGLRQGYTIGRIKSLMIEKIKTKELDNNKEDLLSFLKSINLSSLD